MGSFESLLKEMDTEARVTPSPQSVPVPGPELWLNSPADGDIDPVIAGYLPRVRLWLLRLICHCGVRHEENFVRDFKRWGLARLLPVPQDVLTDGDDLGDWLAELDRRYRAEDVAVTGPFAMNLDTVGEVLALSEMDREVLAFFVLVEALEPFGACCSEAFSSSDEGRLPWQLSRVIGYSREQLQAALSGTGALVSAGLVSFTELRVNSAVPNIVEINYAIRRLVTGSAFTTSSLLQEVAAPIKPPTLGMADFDYMASQRDLVAGFLKTSGNSSDRQSILFDGPPGVGKTELARLVAGHLGFEAYGVSEVDSDGNSAGPSERLFFLRMAQNLLGRKPRSLLIFDEADAVLGACTNRPDRYTNTKAAVNRWLEEFKVPTIWITNDGDQLDPAVLRRFELVIRFSELPAQKRQSMLIDCLPPDALDQVEITRLTKLSALTPARIAQASRVARRVAADDPQTMGRVFQQVLEENLGLKLKPTPKKSTAFEIPYRLELINADVNLPALVKSLGKTPSARLCLFGPPGTGKTRFVHHLAAANGLELKEYRASDLLGMYVGNTEKQIAAMFNECAGENKLLFLDEADSLLRSRATAVHRYEVGQVNELLKGLEEFQGLFVAGTNLMASLDSAVLRRLDFKIHFDYLLPEQAWKLFLALARHAGVRVRGHAASQARELVGSLGQLAPGDFALLARRLKINPQPLTARELAGLLETEARMKPDYRSKGVGIGFTAPLAAGR
ncbi:MAG: AAA family ATPase [Wenzhouxiangella sp.]